MNKPALIFWLAFTQSAFSGELPQQLLAPGGIAIISVGSSENTTPNVFYQNQEVLVVEFNASWTAVIGISLSTTPGEHEIRVETAGSPYKTIQFIVANKDYPSQHITIKNKRLVNPDPFDLARIEKEKIPINKTLNSWRNQPAVDMDFAVPVVGRLSSPFGLRRFFNKQARKPHSGLDIAAPIGTPITAPAKGIITNTGNYFFNGNSVFLDHGRGLITGYFHMNDISVRVGQSVESGDLLGTVGETGRVTGPHLHWNVYLNRIKVDPALFVAGRLSERVSAD